MVDQLISEEVITGMDDIHALPSAGQFLCLTEDRSLLSFDLQAISPVRSITSTLKGPILISVMDVQLLVPVSGSIEPENHL